MPNLIDIDNFNKNVKLLSGTGTDFKNEKTYNGFLARTMRIKNEIEKEILEKANENRETKIMKFSTVIGNPPYNNDEYIDFVNLAKYLAEHQVCMITPAKWQAKGGIKNELFRQTIVPYMKEIVYYPCSLDVFDIDLQGGVCYYTLEKELVTNTVVIRKGNLCKEAFKNGSNNSINRFGSLCSMMPDDIIRIIHKVNGYSNSIKIESKKELDGKYNVKITNVFSDVKKLSKNPSLVLIEPYIQKGVGDKNTHTSCIGVFDTEIEAKSFISYLNSRLVRFMVLMNAYTVAIINDETWRFVPAPEAFDHIFTDAELYEKYNLTQEEINIIESVIKERK